MASPIYLVAIITPKPGKADKVRCPLFPHGWISIHQPLQVLELLQTHSEFVKKNEPGTLKYEINVDTKPSGVKEIVVVEMQVPISVSCVEASNYLADTKTNLHSILMCLLKRWKSFKRRFRMEICWMVLCSWRGSKLLVVSHHGCDAFLSQKRRQSRHHL